MINLAVAEFLFALILLVIAYFISHTINGYLQATILNALGDSTAKDAGYQSLNPLDHIDTFGFLALIIFGIGWLQTIPIDPYSFTGAFRYLRLLLAFFVEALVSVCIATLSLSIAVYYYGYPFTIKLIFKLINYYSRFFLSFLSSTSTLNLASVFSEQHTTTGIVFAFLLISIVYLNILIATISSIFNGFRYLLVVGFERGYTYMEYADYLVILGPILVIYVFGDQLSNYLLGLTQWGACHIACLFGI
jgi:hypothetical protein